MTHSASTTPTVIAVGPSGPGAIAGFEVTCPACGFTFRSSLRTIADADAFAHVRHMIAREAAASRAAGRSLFECSQAAGLSKDWLRAQGVR